MCELNLCLFVCLFVLLGFFVEGTQAYLYRAHNKIDAVSRFLDAQCTILVPSKNGRFCLEAEMFQTFSESMFNEVSVGSCGQCPLWDVHVLLV